MTVPAQDTRVTYTASGSSDTFAYPFRILNANHLLVQVDGVTATDYTLTGVDNEDGGNVVFDVTPTAGAEIVIMRDMDYGRTDYDYQQAGELRALTLNKDIDSLAMQIQQLAEQISRAPLLAITTGLTGLNLPNLEALKYLRANSDASGMEWADSVVSSGTFLQSGAGAIEREANAKMAESISAADFGFSADNDGTENLTALSSAIAAALGRVIDIGPGTFYLDPGLGLDTILRGKGRARTIIKKSANGDHVNFYTNAGLRDLTLDGDGANYTGRGLVIAAGESQQTCHNVNIADYDGYCIDFTDTTAGSQSTWDTMKIYRHGGVSAGHAVHIEDVLEAAAYPRKWANIESEGTKFVTLGGCNGFFVTNSYIGEVEYSDNSRGATFADCRYGSNSSAVTMRGFNHAIVGCNVSPVITLAAGVGECAIAGNSYNNAIPIIDNSGNGGRNIIDTVAVGYEPVLTSGGTAPDIGNGSIDAVYVRHGACYTVTVNLLIGSTTNLGTGELRFSLPATPVSTGSGIVQHVGQCVCYDSSANQREYGHVAITPSVPYATCAYDADVVFVNGPFVWATGDWLRFTATYPA